MQSTSIKAFSMEEFSEQVDSICAESFHPTLAIVFAPATYDWATVCDVLDAHEISVFGASSYGQFIDEQYEKDSIVAMLLTLPREAFQIEMRETGDQTTQAIARSIGEAGTDAFERPAFIVASGGVRTDGEQIVRGIQEAAGRDAGIYGGLAAANFTTMDTFVFTRGKVTHNGILVLVIDQDRVKVEGLATGGSQPVGTYHTITKSKNNVVCTIDDKPALDVLLRYSGREEDRVIETGRFLYTASRFQIQMERDHATPLVRAPMDANWDDRSVIFAGTVPEGVRVKFSILPGFEVVDNVVSDFSEYSKEHPEAEALILFSCHGREIAFGPWMEEEIKRLRAFWDAPLAGFFTFGEIGQVKNRPSEFHNLTCSLVLLSEV